MSRSNPTATPPELGAQPNYEEAWLSGPDGHLFYTRTYIPTSPPRGVVLFLHGFADHSTRHEHDHAEWATHGIVLFTYDQRGFGRTALDRVHGSGYGRTDARCVEEDLAWWITHVVRRWEGLPVFLMGYSAGGGYALAFCTKPKWAEHVNRLSGVIVLSPLFTLTHPPLALLKAVVKILNYVAPYMTIPAPMPEMRFSRDPAVAEKLRSDPLRKAQSTPRCLTSMFTECETLFKEGWKLWPKSLPLSVIHGTGDDVNSCDATVEWFNKVKAQNKKLTLIEDAYHDLVNEIDDIPERVASEYITWVEANL